MYIFLRKWWNFTSTSPNVTAVKFRKSLASLLIPQYFNTITAQFSQDIGSSEN